jgi:hypothetical protein
MGVAAMLDTVKNKILDVVNEKIANLIVVPNTMGVVFEPDADRFQILKPRPKGVLTLKISRAADLLAMDYSLLKKATSDPYIKVRCGAQLHKSETQMKTLNPQFGFEAELLIISVYQQYVEISLWDWDMASSDDFLGRIELQVVDMVRSGGKEQRVQLEDERGERGKNGSLYLSAVYRPLHLDSNRGAEVAHLLCGVYTATNVNRNVDGTEYWLVAQCTTHRNGSKAVFNLRRSGTEDEAPVCLKSPKKVIRRTLRANETSPAQLTTMKSKVEVLHKYSLSSDDLSKIFGVHGGMLSKHLDEQGGTADIDTLRELQANAVHNIEFNHAFDFLVKNFSEAVVEVELRCQAPNGKEQSLGNFRYPVAQLKRCTRCTDFPVAELRPTTPLIPKDLGQRTKDGSSIVLNMKLQARFLGSPTRRPDHSG